MWFSYSSTHLTNICQNRFELKFNLSAFSHVKWILSLGRTVISPFHFYQNQLPSNILKVNFTFPLTQCRGTCTHCSRRSRSCEDVFCSCLPLKSSARTLRITVQPGFPGNSAGLLFREKLNTLG